MTASPPASNQPDTLARICADKLRHVARCKSQRPLSEVEAAARAAGPVRGFADSLRRASADGYGLIAEIKRASPSKGLIRNDFDPASLAQAYARGGAACLSVLTDVPYFQGSDEFLVQARAACGLPVLRKDFTLDPYQVVEARALGADCILLIMAALDDATARSLSAIAKDWGMDVLIEVHDGRELDRALALECDLLGVNNRNLKTLAVDLQTSIDLVPKIPADRVPVVESGLSTHADLVSMAEVGARCFLVGESLMRQPDVEAAVRALLGTAAPKA